MAERKPPARGPETRLCACGCGEPVRSNRPRDRFINEHWQRVRSRQVQGCTDCGGRKGRRRGRRLCDDCLAARGRPVEKEATAVLDQPTIPGLMRFCSRCRKVLLVTAFPPRGTKLSSYCATCDSERIYEGKLRRHGLTLDDYTRMFAAQNGRCAICLGLGDGRRLAVDHDHETGAVRGLLCMACNRNLLGASGDDPGVLRRAAAYLEQPTAIGGKASDYPEYAELQVERWMDELRQVEPDSLHVLAVSSDGQPVEDALCFIPRDEFVARFGEERLAELS